MNVVDTSGWLEYFADGPNADDFSVPLKDVKNLIVPTISIYEVFKVVLRERGEDAALQIVAVMKQGKVVDITFEIALQSAKTSLEYKMPMADSIILTVARLNEAIVWTQDEDFEGMEGVKYLPKKSA